MSGDVPVIFVILFTWWKQKKLTKSHISFLEIEIEIKTSINPPYTTRLKPEVRAGNELEI